MATPRNLALTSIDTVKAYLGITVTTHDAVFVRLIKAVSDAIETYCNRKFSRRAYTLERVHGDGTAEIALQNYPIISIERVAVGTVGAMQVKCTAADAFSGTVSVTRSQDTPPSNTHLRLTIHGGASAGTTNLAFGTYATITTLAAQVTATAGWTGSVIGSYGGWSSTELVQAGSSECLNTNIAMEVPDTRLDCYDVDHKNGIINALSDFNLRPVFGSGWNNIWVDYTAGYETIPDDLEQIAINIIADIHYNKSTNPAMISEKIGDYSYKLAGPSEIRTAVSRHREDLDMWRRIEFS